MSRRRKNKNKSQTNVIPVKTVEAVKPKIEVKELSNTTKNRPIELRFSPTAWAKLLFMRDADKTEVGGFAVTLEDDLLYVEDFILPKQKCSSVSVEFDDDSVADIMDDMVDRGYQPKQFMRIWIHTHPNMSASPSMTDEKTFARVFGNCDWAIMAIISTTGDKYCRLQINSGPFPGSFQIPIKVDYDSYDFPASDSQSWLEEHTEKVGKYSYVTNWHKNYSRHYGYHGGYQGDFPGQRYTPPISCGSSANPLTKNNAFSKMSIDEDEYDGIEDLVDAIEDAGYDPSDFEVDFDFDTLDDIPKDVVDMLDANQLSLLMNMTSELREYAINDLKQKLKIGD